MGLTASIVSAMLTLLALIEAKNVTQCMAINIPTPHSFAIVAHDFLVTLFCSLSHK
jgi:hypothetical protein